MAIRQNTILICDRCKHEENAADYMKNQTWGQMDVKWRGELGCRDYNLNGAQTTHAGTAWLCKECAKEFLKFMNI